VSPGIFTEQRRCDAVKGAVGFAEGDFYRLLVVARDVIGEVEDIADIADVQQRHLLAAGPGWVLDHGNRSASDRGRCQNRA
jgi:hypothetical protein